MSWGLEARAGGQQLGLHLQEFGEQQFQLDARRFVERRRVRTRERLRMRPLDPGDGGAGIARLLLAHRFGGDNAAHFRPRRRAPALPREAPALLAQQLLHALDGVAVGIKQPVDAAQQIDILGPVVAPATGPLQRTHLREFCLPEAQHVLRHVELRGHFANGAKGFRRLGAGHGGGRWHGDHSSASNTGVWPLITAFSTWLGRNTSTRRGAIGTSSPVLGLRPMRCDFCRTAKVPNEESLTVSLRASAAQISSSMSSTICADSVRDSPTDWKTDSVRSARVKVFVVMATATPSDGQSLGAEE